MIKIGRLIDVDNVERIPQSIKNNVLEDLETLDYYYGDKRNVDSDMGGFVVICEKSDVVDIPNFDLKNDVPEYVEKLGDWTKMLFISGMERNIIVYQK